MKNCLIVQEVTIHSTLIVVKFTAEGKIVEYLPNNEFITDYSVQLRHAPKVWL